MRYLNAGVWIIATAAIVFGLYVGRDILAPLALAAFLWLIIEAFARMMQTRVPALPRALTQVLAVLLIMSGAVAVIVIFIDGLDEFAKNASTYETHINTLIRDAYAQLNLTSSTVEPPTLSALLFNQENTRFVQPILDSVQGLASSFVLILIYIAFLFMAETSWPQKLDEVFKDTDTRQTATEVSALVRKSMEEYLWVQTMISIIITILTYITLTALGLDNALFWAFIVFFLNYIPTIGSIVAAFLPGFFALAQPDWPSYMPSDPTLCALIVFASVSVWQFVIGNFVQPRLMGETLNLSSLVVLISLAVWGAIWGIPGMFLSAPLTVLMMILLAQTPGARWIAILLSADGHPIKSAYAAHNSDIDQSTDELSKEISSNSS